MKRHNCLSFTSFALFGLGFGALAAVMPQAVFAASNYSSSEVLVVAQASTAEVEDTDKGKAKKDTPVVKRVKRAAKPKQAGRVKNAPDPKIRAVKREKKIQLILKDQRRSANAAIAALKKSASIKRAAAKISPGDDDAGDAKKDTGPLIKAKRVAKPKQAGRENLRDPKLRAKRRNAKLKLLAKDRQ